MSGSGREACRMSKSGRVALLDVRELSGGTLGFPEVVGSPSEMSGSGLAAVPNVGLWS